jgi:hypothetical protein
MAVVAALRPARGGGDEYARAREGVGRRTGWRGKMIWRDNGSAGGLDCAHGMDDSKALFVNLWNEGERMALGWKNFHYKSKFSKIPFNPLPST